MSMFSQISLEDACVFLACVDSGHTNYQTTKCVI